MKAAAEADIVVLTVPYSAHVATLESVKAQVQGKIFIDVSVPLDPENPRKMKMPAAGSATEEAQAFFGLYHAEAEASGLEDLLERLVRILTLTFGARAGRLMVVDSPPTGKLARHLYIRRGRKADIRNVDSMGRAPALAILEETNEIGADLLVMGAYAHSRLRELVFGGATRDLLRATTVPVLMAH